MFIALIIVAAVLVGGAVVGGLAGREPRSEHRPRRRPARSARRRSRGLSGPSWTTAPDPAPAVESRQQQRQAVEEPSTLDVLDSIRGYEMTGLSPESAVNMTRWRYYG